ncbi:MAG: imidazoleglycerol-phosphate dehydratase, partial [Candidatus Omnitrophica bacterium]|nr:imidazoleglycerol-phosphate dehydratase [Candidatus Omnitrophota bacterium]
MTVQQPRTATVRRKTTETEIEVELNIDGSGELDKIQIKSGLGLVDHLLGHVAFHGFFDLKLSCKGDLHVDAHHSNEDIGIVLGQAFAKALDEKVGINRYGFAACPMDEDYAEVAIDMGDRYAFVAMQLPECGDKPKIEDAEEYSMHLALDLLDSFAKKANINLHVSYRGHELHHVAEAIFKAFGRALDEACKIDPRRKGVP